MPKEMFQSAPVIADGRARGVRYFQLRLQKFQSAPVIADGRASALSSQSRKARCFNPRPSSLTGEPMARSHFLARSPVSIRARDR